MRSDKLKLLHLLNLFFLFDENSFRSKPSLNLRLTSLTRVKVTNLSAFLRFEFAFLDFKILY